MNPWNRRLGLAMLAAVLAIGFAGYEWYEAALARAIERGLQARRTELDLRVRAADQDLHQAQMQRSAQKSAAAQSPAQPAAAAAPPTPAARVAQSRAAWLGAHPAARARYLKDFRDMLDETYGPVFRTRKLSADQIEKVKDLLTQREDKNITMAQTASAQGLDPTDTSLADMNNQLTRANNAAIKALVGNDDYQAIHQYLRQTAVVPLVSTLSSTMAGLNQPLTADQAVKLTAALAASSQRRPDTAAIPNTVNWEQAMASAQTILSADQLSTFALIQQQSEGRQQISDLQRTLTSQAK